MDAVYWCFKMANLLHRERDFDIQAMPTPKSRSTSSFAPSKRGNITEESICDKLVDLNAMAMVYPYLLSWLLENSLMFACT